MSTKSFKFTHPGIDTPKKIFKKDAYRNCIICGSDIVLKSLRFTTLKKTSLKETLSEVVDLSKFDNESRACKSCTTSVENLPKLINRYREGKKKIIEKFNETCDKYPPGQVSVKRLAKSQSPGRSPSSKSSICSSRKRLCLVQGNAIGTLKSRRKLPLPEKRTSESEKENIVFAINTITGNPIVESITSTKNEHLVGSKRSKEEAMVKSTLKEESGKLTGTKRAKMPLATEPTVKKTSGQTTKSKVKKPLVAASDNKGSSGQTDNSKLQEIKKPESKAKQTTRKSFGYKQVRVSIETIESGATRTRTLSGTEAIIVKLISNGMHREAMMMLIKLPEYKDYLIQCFIKDCKDELTNLSSLPTSSILRKTDSESIKNLGTNAVLEEFLRIIPTLTQTIKKITKDDDYITTQICNTIVSSHNQHLSALRHKNGLFFRQCGLLRKGQEMLCKMKVSTHPTEIRTKLIEMGNNHDSTVLKWKTEKEEAIKKGECGENPIVVGDNLDGEVNTKHQTETNTNKSFHYFNMYAIKEKVNGSELSDTRKREIKDVSPEEFMPTERSLQKVEKEFVILAARVIVKYIPSMKIFKDVVVHHIKHDYSEIMTEKSEQVPLGAYALNENRHEDMIEIIERIQDRYVVKDESGKNTTFFGGDQLTEERARTVQNARADGKTVEERLQGITPKFEDWHAIRTAYDSALKIFRNTQATGDSGTYLPNAIKSGNKNALRKVENKFQEVKEFFDVETKALLVSGFLEQEGAERIENYHPPSELVTKDPDTRRRWLHGRIHLFLKNNVMGCLNSLSKMLPEQQTHKCRDKSCTKTFFFLPAKNLHEEIQHGLPPLATLVQPEAPKVKDDLYKYSCTRLCTGLLLLNANDAVKEGDGDRLVRFYNIFTFIFRMNGNDKYAYICLRLKARELALLSPRDFHRLKWNRFVNNQGGYGQNISCDLRLEHINKVTKALIKSQGMQNLTDESVESITKSIGGMEELVQSSLADAGVTKRSGHHSNKHQHQLFHSLFKEVHCVSKNFRKTEGRRLDHFKDFDSDIFSKLNKVMLLKWIKRLTKKWQNQDFTFNSEEDS
ncbi:uncharacterized protein [Clytia hemisphaerica]